MIPYILRKYKESDESFVYNTWLKVYHESCPINFCPDKIYFDNQSKIIKQLLNTSNVLMACHPDDPDSLIGYIVYQEFGDSLIVHWLHVKSIFRFKGVATDIIHTLHPNYQQEAIIVSHNSKNFNKLRHKFNLVYHPYIIGKI